MPRHPTFTSHTPGKPDKTVELNGKAVITNTGDRIEVTPSAGAVSVIVQASDGSIVFVWHPLSGWYVAAVAPEREEPA